MDERFQPRSQAMRAATANISDVVGKSAARVSTPGPQPSASRTGTCATCSAPRYASGSLPVRARWSRNSPLLRTSSRSCHRGASSGFLPGPIDSQVFDVRRGASMASEGGRTQG